MRIIAGKYRGKRLNTLEGNLTRPTADKVKESVFNILTSNGEICGNVLDLFGGSGALAIEALSRGADSAVIVDKNPSATKIIISNLKLCNAVASVYNTDWQVALRKLRGEKFDLIFVDAPYALLLESRVVETIKVNDLLTDGGVIVVERNANNDFEFDLDYFTCDSRNYGNTAVSFLRKK